MPRRKNVASYCFVLDLHMKNIEHVKKVFYRILVRMSDENTKSNPDDVYKIILVGSRETDNLNDYRNVSVFQDWSSFDAFQLFTDVIEKLEVCETSDERGDLYEGLELALEHTLNDKVVTLDHEPKNVIVFSDLLFPAPQSVSTDSFKLNLQDVWLYVAGPDVKVRRFKTFKNIRRWSRIIDTENQDINLKKNLFIFNSIKKNGIIADLDVCADLMISYGPSMKAPYPWYCDLEIGEHIALKVNVFKLVDDYHQLRIPKNLKKMVKVNDYDLRWNTKKLYNPNTGEQVTEAQTGYKFKGHYAFLTDEQYKILAKKYNDDKCFQLKYFVPYDEVVSNMFFCKNSLSRVVADTRKSEHWHEPLTSLAKAMHQEKKAAVFKRVYAKGPQFREMPYLMFTCPDHGHKCLLLAKLPYSHEWREDIDHYKQNLIQLVKEGEASEVVERDAVPTETDFNDYLEQLTIKEDDLRHHKILCVAPYLAQNPNLNSQIDYLISNSLRSDLYNSAAACDNEHATQNENVHQDFPIYKREIPEFEMPPFICERSRNVFESLDGKLPENLDYETNNPMSDEMKKKFSEMHYKDIPPFEFVQQQPTE